MQLKYGNANTFGARTSFIKWLQSGSICIERVHDSDRGRPKSLSIVFVNPVHQFNKICEKCQTENRVCVGCASTAIEILEFHYHILTPFHPCGMEWNGIWNSKWSSLGCGIRTISPGIPRRIELMIKNELTG